MDAIDNPDNPNFMSSWITNKTYLWKPKEDITPYELALCLPIMLDKRIMDFEELILSLPENVQRHFEEYTP
jgi:hypothetical protein